MKAKPSVLVHWRIAIGAALMILPANSLVLAQGRASGYVDGTSSCLFRTGDRDCRPPIFPEPAHGPWRMIGEGANGVAPGGMLSVKGGFYGEAVFLNKNIQITAENGVLTISPPSLARFDMVADAVDDNGLPLNPRWGDERAPGTVPDPDQCPQTDDPTVCVPLIHCSPQRYHDTGRFPCTNQFTYKNYGPTVFGTPRPEAWDPAPLPRFLPLCGPHINWFGATYYTDRGSLTWDQHSCPHRDDDDYTMNITRADRAGYALTRQNIHIEFDSGETVDNFLTPWWLNFKEKVDQDGCGTHGSRATAMLGGDNGKFAIVTGLMGFDVEHDIHVELHPVWALAILEDSSRFVHDEDSWVFFVRNWGNEGFCGRDQQFINFPNNRYTFRLPWKPGATSVNTDRRGFHPYNTQNPQPSVSWVRGLGVFVTFTLDPPRDQGSMWDGWMRLVWDE